MFFCEQCQKKNNLPGSKAKHAKNCEICGVYSVCNEVDRKLLPDKIRSPLV